ncbi:integrator complex subunit 14 [Drosophila grimshawi]|uniref:Integrator complex subunit 14 n=1 Tax=Drosophila grimshawi TaxID=7222 RepID=B4JDH3_DROGR|nr:integrator complex subunit 14 [Drosophila grimshawi]EDW03343.1 GH10553 [Drosophila grimshawi]
MPTIIALDASLSMLRPVPGRNEHTYISLAIKGIQHLLDNLTASGKLEHLALVVYTTVCELKVDFTRDYDQIRQAIKKIEPLDKACLMTMLKTSVSLMATWGTQNLLQLVVFTDCGPGFGSTSLAAFLEGYTGKEADPEYAWLKLLAAYHLNFICLGMHGDLYFTRGVTLHQQLLDNAALKGQLFMTKPTKGAEAGEVTTSGSHKSELGRTALFELIERLCESSYKSTEVTLKCGHYFRMEGQVLLWPPTVPYEQAPLYGGEPIVRHIEQRIDVCGFLSLSDIGSPATLSRHWVLAKVDREKPTRRSGGLAAVAKPAKLTLDTSNPHYELEKLEQDVRDFYMKDNKDAEESGDDGDVSVVLKHSSTPQTEQQKDTLCVLLHGALKLENMAALVLLGERWYGFMYAYNDSKKKSNFMLNVLPPGSNVIPWLGDLELLGFPEDVPPGESASFPVRSERRSYSQSSVVWIRQASLQSDVQKVLRHAKKMPDKTQHFYKELNRIRRAALALGFVELLEALALLIEKETAQLTLNGVGSECTLQLQHAATELRKTSNRDIKSTIVPLQKASAADSTSSAAPPTSAGSYLY